MPFLHAGHVVVEGSRILTSRDAQLLESVNYTYTRVESLYSTRPLCCGGMKVVSQTIESGTDAVRHGVEAVQSSIEKGAQAISESVESMMTDETKHEREEMEEEIKQLAGVDIDLARGQVVERDPRAREGQHRCIDPRAAGRDHRPADLDEGPHNRKDEDVQPI